jgi:hypothetical protein
MSIFDSIKSLFAPRRGSGNGNATWLYVRCKTCGTPLAVRVDLRNEPSPDYERGGYVLRKEMMDDKCFTLMRAEVFFDEQRHIVEQSVDKGEFITRDEYEKATQHKG